MGNQALQQICVDAQGQMRSVLLDRTDRDSTGSMERKKQEGYF